LNAAGSRGACEAGMGFAVVADEVGKLAQLSAQAACETTDTIQSAIGTTGGGVKLRRQVAAALDDVAAKVADRAGGIRGRRIG